MSNLIEFYQRIPKGPAPLKAPVQGPLAAYKRAYFGDNASYKPIMHVIFAVGILSYALDYHFHLSMSLYYVFV